MQGEACPEPEDIQAFVEQAVAPDEREALERHVDRCAECRLVVALLGRAPGEAAASASALLERGARFGRYVIVELIGQGGMGAVYAAYDPELDRKIALKLLRPDLQDVAPETGARLQREARAMARLQDAHVATVFDVGTEDGRVFIAMELVDGGTLRTWLRDAPREASEILAHHRFAGLGLAAAHRAGLVHGDFKPDNVLVGKDGRVRVSDFGLAVGAGSAEGTPAYMAPEQLEGQVASVQADQFAFCVALHEALWGAPPFGSRTPNGSPALLDERRAAIRAGAAAGGGPAWLRRTIARGLEADPARRWPSMDALLAAIDAGLRRRRRRRIVLVAALVLAPLLVLAVRGRPHPNGPPLCASAADRLTGIWDAPRQAEIRSAFAATGAPFADGAWRGVSVDLDGYARAWVKDHDEACAATRIRRERPEAMMVRRMTCLDKRLRALDALTDLLTRATAADVARAGSAAVELPSLVTCDDPGDTEAAVAPGMLGWIAGGLLVDADALQAVGRYEEADARAEAALSLARVAGDATLLARALEVAGLNRYTAGSGIDGAVSVLDEAVLAADGIGDDAARAQALGDLVYPLRDRGDRTRLHAILDELEALDRRLRSPAVHARRLRLVASTLDDEEHYEDAAALASQAEDAVAAISGAESIEVARALEVDALAEYHLGRLDDASRLAVRALAMRRKLSGAWSPDESFPFHLLGDVAIARGRNRVALAFYQREQEVSEGVYGPDSDALVDPIVGMARALDALGRTDEAIAEGRRAVAISRAGDVHGAILGGRLDDFASLLIDGGRYAEAVDVETEALALCRAAGTPDDLQVAQILVWLGRALLGAGRPAEALARIDEAILVGERSPTPWTTDALVARGETLRALGRPAEAAVAYRKAIAVDEPGGQTVSLAEDQRGLGVSLLDAGDAAGAAEALARSLELYAQLDPPADGIGAVRFDLARALAGPEPAHAVALAREARDELAGSDAMNKRAEIDAWLRSR